MTSNLATAEESAMLNELAYRVRNVVICSTVSEVASGVVVAETLATLFRAPKFDRPLVRDFLRRAGVQAHKLPIYVNEGERNATHVVEENTEPVQPAEPIESPCPSPSRGATTHRGESGSFCRRATGAHRKASRRIEAREGATLAPCVSRCIISPAALAGDGVVRRSSSHASISRGVSFARGAPRITASHAVASTADELHRRHHWYSGYRGRCRCESATHSPAVGPLAGTISSPRSRSIESFATLAGAGPSSRVTRAASAYDAEPSGHRQVAARGSNPHPRLGSRNFSKT